MVEEQSPPFDFQNPPWTKNYDEGVYFKVDVPRILLHEMLKGVTEKYPDRPAVTFYGKSISYQELWSEVLKVAEGLKKLGLGEDSCIVLILPNVPHYIILSFAAFSIGAKVCLFNPLWSAYQVEDELGKVDPDVIIVQDILAEKYETVLEDRSNVYQALLGDYATTSFKFKVSMGRMLGKLPRPSKLFKPYRELVANEPLDKMYKGDPAETVAALLYTGGTTGTPKAVMLTHLNIMANIIYQKIWFHRKEGRDRVLGLLPFFHAYGFGSIMGLSLHIAANLVLQLRFDPEEFVDTIIKERITLVPGAPTIYLMLLKHIPREKLEKMRGIPEICFSGAAPLPVEIIKRWEEITECRIVEGYGLTETSPVVAANPIYGKRKHGSIGLPMPNTLLAPADLVEPKLIDGQGELVVSGLQVMKGYYNMPEENKIAFFDCCGRKWFRTGDIGYMDKEGYFYIVDRKKDIIKYKGHSVYPRYIEEILYKHECVAEVAVIGIPDPEAGENIKAVISLKPECRGKLSEEELKEWSKQYLGAHEYPRIIEFVDELPKSPAGKILRRVVRERELEKLKNKQ